MEHHPEPMKAMAREHYGPYRWVQAVTACLAAWLVASPFTLGFESMAMVVSDVVSGALALVLALLARKPTRGAVSWLIGAVGVWVMLSPLVFWARESAAYDNATVIGALFVAFGFVIPMGMKMQGAATPPGWSYNPSAWPQRAPVIGLGFVAFLAARYMAAYQLGYHAHAWDPFFGDGTRRVLTSKVSRAFPVSDAGLGAALYLIETLMGFMGDERRWRTMPWMVAGFGIVVVPLGVVSIVLVMLQPVSVGAWCGLCLFTALCMLLMIPLALDEVVAMLECLARKKREGLSFWRVFWLGVHEDAAPADEASGAVAWRPGGMIRGATVPWPLLISALAGMWIMASPAYFDLPVQSAPADVAHVLGALVVVVAVISFAEVARPLRYVNVVLGLAVPVVTGVLAAADFPVSGDLLASEVLAGMAVALFSAPLGPVHEHYGSFDHALVWSPRRKTRRRLRSGR